MKLVNLNVMVKCLEFVNNTNVKYWDEPTILTVINVEDNLNVWRT